MLRMKCRKCGSENVSSDATAVWNYAAQEWELGATFDGECCKDCGDDCHIDEFEDGEPIMPKPETVSIDRAAYDRARTALARIVFESECGCLRDVSGASDVLTFAQQAYKGLPSLQSLDTMAGRVPVMQAGVR